MKHTNVITFKIRHANLFGAAIWYANIIGFINKLVTLSYVCIKYANIIVVIVRFKYNCYWSKNCYVIAVDDIIQL